MHDKILKVKMLGTFSLELGDKQINCDINRSKRIWVLLAYIIFNHKRTVSQNELIDIFWNDEKDRANPAGSLKTSLHRARGILELLDPELGREVIVYGKGGYRVSPYVKVELDTEAFEELYEKKDYGSALSLYGGEFLSKLSSDTWTVPIATFYQNLYGKCLEIHLPRLFEEEKYEECILRCKEALLADPYRESIYQHLMRSLIAADKREEAIAIYEEMNKLLMANFGVIPSPESRELYREALRTVSHDFVHPGTLNEQLRESGPVDGALICDYDFFKMLYQAEARLIARSGNAVHIALISVKSKNGDKLTRRILDNAMESLTEHLRRSLRKGDIISKCSPAQLIIMLPNANFENSCMVCKRVIKAYEKLKPHSTVKIDFSVQPMDSREECAPPAGKI
ncbi:MAG: hypothetical protein E7623_03845 [Ruminococcaceae bacterium]|nr:hypothetical protein [Oscillospiraceae bacterium]